MTDVQPFDPYTPTSATFTMTLERLIGYTGGTVEIAADGIARITNDKTGLQYFTTPWDVTHAPILRGKIIDHFWKSEIGQETPEMFQYAMRTKMNEIMPYYNDLYKTTQLEYEALSTINLRTLSANDMTTEQTNHNENTTVTNGKNTSRAVASDTPQTMLKGDGDYARSAQDVNGEADSTANANDDTTANGTVNNNGDTTVSGYTGVPADLVQRYRAAILNVDLMVINELEELFMLVFDNGDTYAPRPPWAALYPYPY